MQTYEYSSYKKLLENLTTEDVALHTYTPSHERTNGFVIRGLDFGPTTDEVKASLETEHKISVKKVYQTKTNSGHYTCSSHRKMST